MLIDDTTAQGLLAVAGRLYASFGDIDGRDVRALAVAHRIRSVERLAVGQNLRSTERHHCVMQ